MACSAALRSIEAVGAGQGTSSVCDRMPLVARGEGISNAVQT